MENIVKSGFQFTNPVLEDIQFKNYPIKTDIKKSKVNVSVQFNSQVSDPQKIGQLLVSKLALTVNAKCTENKNRIYSIKVVYSSSFRSNSKMKVEEFANLVKVNGSSLLLSYVRTLIADLTSRSGYDAFQLPFVDFTKAIKN